MTWMEYLDELLFKGRVDAYPLKKKAAAGFTVAAFF